MTALMLGRLKRSRLYHEHHVPDHLVPLTARPPWRRTAKWMDSKSTTVQRPLSGSPFRPPPPR